jgi:hypothetical protein
MLAAPGDEAARAERGLRLALIRLVRPDEVAAVVAAVRLARAAYAAEPSDALALLAATRATPIAGVSPAERAAWTVAASVIINLDEFVTRN